LPLMQLECFISYFEKQLFSTLDVMGKGAPNK